MTDLECLPPNPPGDMSPEDFKRYGYQVVDWIANYLASGGDHPVLSQIKPGDIKAAVATSPPAHGEPFDGMLADVDNIILPGVTHWNHPAFFAYFAITGSGPGILGELFSAAFNVNAMMWRTGPAATELEEVTLEWLRQMMGLPAEFEGVIYDTASVASLCAIAAAREVVPGLSVREEGLARPGADGGPPPRLRLYSSEHAHSSIDKAAITLGLGQNGLRKIPAGEGFSMDPDALQAAITADRKAGWIPFCVVATVGTTSTTSIDPVPEIADICEREQLWLHVDAAYGGSAAVAPEMQWILTGCDRADSLVTNPHKWMFVPFDLSVMFCQRLDILAQAFSLMPEYLRTVEAIKGSGPAVKNFMDYGPQLGRRFRALKLWFVIRYFGVDGLAERIRYHIKLAGGFAQWVDASPDFERLAPTPFSTICFRVRPARFHLALDTDAGADADAEKYLDALNEKVMEDVNRAGKVFLSHTRLNGKFTLRLAIGNMRTAASHVKLAWDELNRVARELDPGMHMADL